MNEKIKNTLYGLAFFAALVGNSYVNKDLLEATPEVNKITQVIKQEGQLEKLTRYIQFAYKRKYKEELSSKTAKQYAFWIDKYAKENNLDTSLAAGLFSWERSFKNGISDKHLKDKSWGLGCMRGNTKEYFDHVRMARGEKVTHVKGEEYLKFPEAQIKDAIEYLVEKNKIYGDARGYNPGAGKAYADSVAGRQKEIKAWGVD